MPQAFPPPLCIVNCIIWPVRCPAQTRKKVTKVPPSDNINEFLCCTFVRQFISNQFIENNVIITRKCDKMPENKTIFVIRGERYGSQKFW